ncbi:MAG: ROK family protein, partial [Candidatus Tectomicrobia bacterium]|nr:ROK family protein [Candidatus Tectomicrobia bacterium]
GDPLCRELVGEIVQHLGAAVGNIINFLNPEMILLGGGLLEGKGKYLNSIREWARRYAFREAFEATRINFASLDKHTSIRGAAALFCHERLRWRGLGQGA